MKVLSTAFFVVVTLFALVPASTAQEIRSPEQRPTWASSPPAARGDSIPVLIRFRQQPGAAEEALVQAFGGRVSRTFHIIPSIAAEVPPSALPGLRRHPAIVRVEEDGVMMALEHPNVNDSSEMDNSWGVEHMGGRTVHAYNRGDGVKVAIADTGIRCTHLDLNVNCEAGYDFTNNTPIAAGANSDDNGHGGHVAGTVGAEKGNGAEVDDGSFDGGVVGLAPGARRIPLKVLAANGSGNWSWLIGAMEWAVDNGVHVVNMSLGGTGAPADLEDAVNKAYDKGVVLAAAAGNSGTCAGTGNNVGQPASYARVIAVAALNGDNATPCFSSTGPDVELAAPGVSVRSTWNSGNAAYATANGTSMASPHVAALAAQLIVSPLGDLGGADEASDVDCATGPGDGKVDNSDVRIRMQSTALDLSGGTVTDSVSGRDTWNGCGLARAAVAGSPGVGAVTQASTPDVGVWMITTPPNLVAGNTYTVLVDVVNQGSTTEATIVSLTTSNGSVSPASQSVTLTPASLATVSFSWTPATAGTTLTATATLVATDTDTADNTKTVTVSVSGGSSNTLPVANDVSASGNEDTSIVWTPSVSDADGNPLTCSIVQQPPTGTATVAANCVSGTYTPPANFNGPVSFTYKANDGTADSNTATVSIAVTPVNDPPVANGQAVSTTQGAPVNIALTASDVETCDLTFAIASSPTSGSLGTITNNVCAAGNPNTDSASATYTPVGGFTGTDSFTFTVSDGALGNNTATVSITVNPVNSPPVANNDSYTMKRKTTLTVSAPGVLGNDTDPDGNPLTAVLVTGPTRGILTVNSNGSFTYTSPGNFTGTVTFTYKANDGVALSNVATVTITVTR